MSLMKSLAAITCAVPLLLCLSPARAEEPKMNPTLLALEPNKWLKLHDLKPPDDIRFSRQEHGGSCFDSKRGRLVLFGSNTHGKDWTNSPIFFDPVECKWTRLYPNDDKSTYTVDAAGLPVAGPKADHPWAMHTFGALVYDSARDEIIDCSAPLHMVPGRFSNALADIWPKVKRHPTWTFRCADDKWVPLDCPAVHFFPHAAAYDSDRKTVLGYSPGGVYELGGEPRTWTQLVKGGMFGYHNNCAYDSKNKALVNFGTNQNSNDIVVYLTETKEHKKMPTKGTRPPEDQHNPMEFDPVAGVTVVIVDRVVEKDDKGQPTKVQAETWLYDLGKDEWTQVTDATLPFAVGMNYNMEYDPAHKVMLLVTGGTPTVWALRVDPSKIRK